MSTQGQGDDDDLPALFRDNLPDKLSDDLLALAHLSDVDEPSKEADEEMTSGPIRKRRTRNASKPYSNGALKKKTDDEILNDDMKELEFRTRAWKPFPQPPTKQG